MMITYVFRSSKKEEMYLYLPKMDGFEQLDEPLQKTFGKAEFVMMVNLNKRHKLARADINMVKEAINEHGYYLQMPPKPEQLVVNQNDNE